MVSRFLSSIFLDSLLRDTRLYLSKHFNFVYRKTSLFVHSIYRCVYCIIIFIVPFSRFTPSRRIIIIPFVIVVIIRISNAMRSAILN